jgi:hypothetical protein
LSGGRSITRQSGWELIFQVSEANIGTVYMDLAPIMKVPKVFLGLSLAVSVSAASLFAAGATNPEPAAALAGVITNLDRDASMSAESPMLVAYLIEKEYGTREAELKWAVDQKLKWGQIAALAYIQATTGKTFGEMSRDNATRDFSSYAENAGMNCEKMARSLDAFRKEVERERNSQILDRLRASRKVYPLPDLGIGFGLFQEALDFRTIQSPIVDKIENIPGELSKGQK